jgi:ComF family protein
MLISRFKYQGDLAAGELLSDLFTHHAAFTSQPTPDVLIPMPLHPSRLKERGFNQAGLLATRLSKQLHIPVDHHACKRVRATAHQMGLNAGVRKKNLRGAFTCAESLADKSVAIIDDVVTTGATVNELASTLRRGGVRYIEVWCLARTPTP